MKNCPNSSPSICHATWQCPRLWVWHPSNPLILASALLLAWTNGSQGRKQRLEQVLRVSTSSPAPCYGPVNTVRLPVEEEVHGPAAPSPQPIARQLPAASLVREPAYISKSQICEPKKYLWWYATEVL